jgi:hypothetical protein
MRAISRATDYQTLAPDQALSQGRDGKTYSAPAQSELHNAACHASKWLTPGLHLFPAAPAAATDAGSPPARTPAHLAEVEGVQEDGVTRHHNRLVMTAVGIKWRDKRVVMQYTFSLAASSNYVHTMAWAVAWVAQSACCASHCNAMHVTWHMYVTDCPYLAWHVDTIGQGSSGDDNL